MWYKCNDCGNLFEDGEEKLCRENISEAWGSPCVMETYVCPSCGGDYEEVEPCVICGAIESEANVDSGLCDDCVEELRYDYETCFLVGSKDTEAVEINCFLASFFTAEQINEILKKQLEIMARYIRVDCKEFIEADRDWFTEILKEVIK